MSQTGTRAAFIVRRIEDLSRYKWISDRTYMGSREGEVMDYDSEDVVTSLKGSSQFDSIGVSIEQTIV